jgi:hypothetical protein
LGLALAVSFLTIAANAADLSPILESVRTDPSYKVRLQALRVLDRWLDRVPDQLPRALDVLRTASADDPNPLVRALALRTLGQRGSPRELALVSRRAEEEPNPVVRKAAQQAVAILERRWGRERPVVVVEAAPFSAQGRDWTPTFRQVLQAALQLAAGEAYELRSADEAVRSGVWLQATASYSPPGSPSAELRVKMVIGTWPQRNLRHVLTTRASLRVASGSGDVHRLLRAAVDDAVREAFVEIGKGL